MLHSILMRVFDEKLGNVSSLYLLAKLKLKKQTLESKNASSSSVESAVVQLTRDKIFKRVALWIQIWNDIYIIIDALQ